MIQKVLPRGGAPHWGLGPGYCRNHNNRVPVRARAELSILHGLSHNQSVINPATIQGAGNTDIQSGRPGGSCNALKLHGLTLQSVVFTLLLMEWNLGVVYDSWICKLEFS